MQNWYNVMFTPKNTQKSRPAAIAHLDELLDEALKETFPGSDPIAINIELESAERGIATTPRYRFQAHASAVEAVGGDRSHGAARSALSPSQRQENVWPVLSRNALG